MSIVFHLNYFYNSPIQLPYVLFTGLLLAKSCGAYRDYVYQKTRVLVAYIIHFFNYKLHMEHKENFFYIIVS